jgi:hypothetical protein
MFNLREQAIFVDKTGLLTSKVNNPVFWWIKPLFVCLLLGESGNK